jgi:flavin-dependent dehydrogenase
MKYDICVVGAGIAGSSLAYELAPEFDVCLIEERGLENVGRKPCPGAVGRSWFKGFSPVDLGAVVLRIRSMKLSVGGRSLRVRFDGYLLDRHRFCKSLLEVAFSEGCEWVKGRAKPSFENGISYVRAGGRRIEAGVYVDASGSSAVLRRRYLPNRREMFALGCMETIDGEHGNGELDIYFLNHLETSWIFPAEHSTNVGYVAAGVRGSDLGGRLMSFKRKMGLEGARVLERGYRLIPSYKPIRLVYDNIVAIGDAGFTINPITCGGIGPSVLTANMLADSLKRGEGLVAFEAKYWRSLGNTYAKFCRLNRVLRKGWIPLWLAVRAYYSNNMLSKLLKGLLRF